MKYILPTIDKNKTIKEAMRVIDKSGLGIVFVTDEENKFVGVATDGDIRRGILSGIDIEEPIKTIMNDSPLFILDDWKESKLKNFLYSERVKERIPKGGSSLKIPILDKEMHVKDILFLSSKNGKLETKYGIKKIRKFRNVNKVLVVGGAGYLGSVLTRKLLRRGYKVRVLDNLTYGNEGIRNINHENFEFVKGDIRDLTKVVEAVKDTDAVIHLAAIVGDPACVLDPEETIEINYLATKALVETCKYFQINRFVFASTCSVYGATAGVNKLTEESKLNPVSLYARSKIECENAILEAMDENFSPTILRMGTLCGYSPRMRFDLVVNLFTAQSFIEKKITVFGGRQWRPFLHVDDAATAFIKCLESPIEKIRGQIFNVASENCKIIMLSEIIKNVAGKDVKVEVKEKVEDRRNYKVSWKKIEKQIGLTPKKTIKDAIKEIKKVLENGTIKNFKDPKYYNKKYLSLSEENL